MARAPSAGFDRASIPAPIGGWNARDDIGNMKADEAIVLDNWFPQTNYVELRGGSASHATGLVGTVEALFEYSSGTTRKLLGFANGEVLDCSSAGAVGAALATGNTADRWQSVNFRGYGLFVNGADTPTKFDGTTWSTTAWTGSGLTPENLIGINIFKSRVFLIEKDTANYWYAPVNNIAGAVSKVDLSGIAPNGGTLMAMGTWTRDGGAGVDDYAVFLMSSGDLILYQGTDPGNASAWSLVGVFRIGPPIGRRCMLKLGADLFIITQDGYIPMSKVLSLDRTSQNANLSDLISGAVSAAAQAQGSTFGWQICLYPKGNYCLFNVPAGGGTFHQHVVNTTTGKWCRFTGMNASCWAVYNDNLYFGGAGGVVYKADTGTSDNGSNITADGKSSFQYYGGKGAYKLFTMIRPVMASDGNLPVSIAFDVDFSDTTTAYDPSTVTTAGSPWNTSPWNTSPWQRGVSTVAAWRSVAGTGYCAAVRIRTSTMAQVVRWHSTDVQWIKSQGGL